MLIACLGLLGLVALSSAQRRTKEIGVRKVLGATVADILLLLSREFLLLFGDGDVDRLAGRLVPDEPLAAKLRLPDRAGCLTFPGRWADRPDGRRRDSRAIQALHAATADPVKVAALRVIRTVG